MEISDLVNQSLISAIMASGRTQRDISEAAGISEQAMSRIINAKTNPQIITKTKIAQALGVSVESIFSKESE